MTQPTLLELIEDRSTRVETLERVLLAHAIANPLSLLQPKTLPLSESAALALGVILGAQHRAGIGTFVAIELATWAPEGVVRSAAEAANEAAQLTAQDLADAGDLFDVIAFLTSERSRRVTDRRRRRTA